MKILVTHKSAGLQEAGFFVDQEYEVSRIVGETLVGSKWALEVKDAGPAPSNKAIQVPENKA